MIVLGRPLCAAARPSLRAPWLEAQPAVPAMASGFAPAHRGMISAPRGRWGNGRDNPGHRAPNYRDPSFCRSPSRFRERAWSIHPVRAPDCKATDQPVGQPSVAGRIHPFGCSRCLVHPACAQPPGTRPDVTSLPRGIIRAAVPWSAFQAQRGARGEHLADAPRVLLAEAAPAGIVPAKMHARRLV